MCIFLHAFVDLVECKYRMCILNYIMGPSRWWIRANNAKSLDLLYAFHITEPNRDFKVLNNSIGTLNGNSRNAMVSGVLNDNAMGISSPIHLSEALDRSITYREPARCTCDFPSHPFIGV